VQTAGQHNPFHHPNSMHDPGHCCLEVTEVEQGIYRQLCVMMRPK
jgi:hypothetical protein